MHENPHAAIDPKGFRHEVGGASVPQSEQRNGLKTYPDCMQTGTHASGALTPTEAQLSGLERRQNSAMGSRKTVRTARDEDESEAKVRTHVLQPWEYVRSHINRVPMNFIRSIHTSLPSKNRFHRCP